MPNDWALNLSRFLLEAIVSESGRRAKSINLQIDRRQAGRGCNGDELFAPLQTGEAFLTRLEDATGRDDEDFLSEIASLSGEDQRPPSTDRLILQFLIFKSCFSRSDFDASPSLALSEFTVVDQM